MAVTTAVISRLAAARYRVVCFPASKQASKQDRCAWTPRQPNMSILFSVVFSCRQKVVPVLLEGSPSLEASTDRVISLYPYISLYRAYWLSGCIALSVILTCVRRAILWLCIAGKAMWLVVLSGLAADFPLECVRQCSGLRH